MPTILEKKGFPPIEFPPPGGVPKGWRKGRNVAEGYQRGVSLEYGNMSASVDAHPLFRAARAAAEGRSVLDYKRMQNLFLILTCFFEPLEQRHIAEFGCFRGGSLIFMAKIMEALYPDARLFGFDTFAGMPTTDKNVDLHSLGDFSQTSLDEVQVAVDRAGCTNVRLIAGLVEDTFPSSDVGGLKLGLAHIDLDIYSAISTVQYAVRPFMTPGGYIVYDDATASSCIGATEAVEEFIQREGAHSEQIFPHFVFRVPL